jgi:hypothetical protein
VLNNTEMNVELLNQKTLVRDLIESLSRLVNGQVNLPGFGANSLHSFIKPKSLAKIEVRQPSIVSVNKDSSPLPSENEVLDRYIQEGMKLFNQGVYSENLKKKKSDLGIYL